MNKFYKWSLITAGILMAVGFLLAGFCGMVGGRRVVNIIREDTTVYEKMNSFVDNFVWNVGSHSWRLGWSDEDTVTELIVNGNVYGSGKLAEQFAADEIQNLRLELGAGTFTIKEKDVDDGLIDITVDGIGNCKYYVDGSTLYAEGFSGFSVNSFPNNRTNENKFVVMIPQGMSFDEVKVEVGAGIMNLSDLDLDNLNIAIGAGELKMQDITAEEIKAEIGAGVLEAKNVKTVNADISVNLGESVFRGEIAENLKTECNMGNLEFHLSGQEEDYNYKIDCSAGNVNMGSYSFAGLSTERKINNNAEGTFDISCNMGNILIDFDK